MYYSSLNMYEKQIEIWEDMKARGIDDIDDYYNALQDEKESFNQYESEEDNDIK